ncbi:hypothetical protein [Deinococcus soli (ex Cha et al. 2016)]|uniref:Bacteriophage SP-beta YorD domain-containing protein n=1 Tax=Deinococcus soli (ex Cha et al. 2016) TaxID=1309411 RepID=A0A0F7JM29_9DEIO|nr:hypothetical protein [Deinococcus soli (ex Cha et al. 2016)]AKH15948.1 hypothetical protein SY84_01550 [Deinococcus soli (ex Cha et al. 2016)]
MTRYPLVDLVAALAHLHPAADNYRDYRVATDHLAVDGWIDHWDLPVAPPTPGEVAAAAQAARALEPLRQDLRDTQAMLDDRYRLYNRANASGNTAAAAEIQTEITDLLDYMKELRNAPNPA